MGAQDRDKVQLLADLQAGLLDDETAARVRSQVRADPQAQAILQSLNQVRRDVAAVGAADPDSAPEAPREVVARITEALNSAGRPKAGAHFARPQPKLGRIAAGVAGVCAVLVAIGIGTAELMHAPTSIPGTSVTAEHITVSRPLVPLSRDEILGLLDRSPDYGPAGSPLGDPALRASCLSGLGYPASTKVLGARPLEINAHPGVLLVLPDGTTGDLAVLVVAPNCGAADSGLLASTHIPRA